MKMNKSNNKTVRFGYSLVFLLLLPIVIPLLFGLDLSIFKAGYPFFLAAFIYYIYIRFFVKNYYAKKTRDIITSFEKKIIVIDEMLSYRVDSFDFQKEKYSDLEYYFIIYNKEYNKYIRISSVGREPLYYEEFIQDWKGKRITIYINPKDWNDPKKGIKPKIGKQKSYLIQPPPDFIADKNTLRVFKFNMGNYNLDHNYEYSINEDIVRKENIFMVFLWTIPFLITCGYSAYQMIEVYLKN